MRRDTVFLYLKGDSLKEKLISDSLFIYSLFLKDMFLSFEEGGAYSLQIQNFYQRPINVHLK